MNAQTKTIVIIAQAEGIAGMIDREYDYKPPKTVKKMLDNLKQKTEHAFK